MLMDTPTEVQAKIDKAIAAHELKYAEQLFGTVADKTRDSARSLEEQNLIYAHLIAILQDEIDGNDDLLTAAHEIGIDL